MTAIRAVEVLSTKGSEMSNANYPGAAKHTGRHGFWKRSCLVFGILGAIYSAGSIARPVHENSIRQVANNFVANQTVLLGSWNGSQHPRVAKIEPVEYNGELLGYNVTVKPSGFLFMPADNEFSPVLLFSTDGKFDPARASSNPDSPEAWIIPETYAVSQALKRQQPLAANSLGMGSHEEKRAASRSGRAWTFLDKPAGEFKPQRGVRLKERQSVSANAPTDANPDSAVAAGTVITKGPLLTTTWGQGEYYNAYTPGTPGSCQHAPTGCVATATAQLMKYWNWPENRFNWSSMPNALSKSSSAEQVDAVARLMSDVGSDMKTQYRCGASAAAMDVAYNSLVYHFGYAKGLAFSRRSRVTGSAFFNSVRTEIDAGRPALLRMNGGGGGHAVVVDGYQTGGLTDMAHVNMGWDGYLNAYYDITNSWSAEYYWDGPSQELYANIKPNQNVLMSITVVPRTVSLRPGETAHFYASPLDQDGKEMSGYPSYTWSINGGGRLDREGMFVAGSTPGTYTITATTTPEGRAPLVGTATITIIGDTPPTPVPGDINDSGNIAKTGDYVYTKPFTVDCDGNLNVTLNGAAGTQWRYVLVDVNARQALTERNGSGPLTISQPVKASSYQFFVQATAGTGGWTLSGSKTCNGGGSGNINFTGGQDKVGSYTYTPKFASAAGNLTATLNVPAGTQWRYVLVDVKANQAVTEQNGNGPLTITRNVAASDYMFFVQLSSGGDGSNAAWTITGSHP